MPKLWFGVNHPANVPSIGPMDHFVSRTPTKERTGAAASPDSLQPPAAGGSRAGHGLLGAAGSPRPAVRRRLLPADHPPAGPPPSSPSPLPPPATPPSEETVRTVAHLRGSVGCAVQRRLERPPVYARPQLAPVHSQADDSHNLQVSKLPSKYEDTFRSLVGGGGGGSGPGLAPLDSGCRSNLLYALDSLDKVLSSDAHPSREVLTFLIHNIMVVEDCEVRRRCLLLLRQIAYLHPPHGRQMRNLYHSALAGGDSSTVSCWELLKTSVGRCLAGGRPSSPGADGAGGQEHLVSTEFLDLLVSLLEEDISEWSKRLESTKEVLRRPAARPLLARALWRTHEVQGTPGATTGQLCRWLVEAHQQRSGAAGAATCRLLLRLVAMTAELIRMAGQTHFLDVTGSMKSLAMELCRAVLDGEPAAGELEDLLCSLRPAWLSAWLAAGLLELRHDRPRPAELTLARIAAGYLPERPPERTGRPADGRQPLAPSDTNGVAAMPGHKRGGQPPTASPVKKRRVSVNKTDKEGRSQLHVACERGDAALLSACLQQAGVNVNLPDGSGRTALHHAAAAGHTGCMRLLLEHRPHNILRYFSPKKGGAPSDQVAVQLASAAGLSAFHEAVAGGQGAAVRLLWEWCGPSVLHAPTAGGRTPLQLASSDDMRRLLQPGAGLSPAAAPAPASAADRRLSPAPAGRAAVTREYTLLLYHLLAGHLLHTGLTEVRVLLSRRLREEAGTAARPAPLSAAASRQLTDKLCVHYRRELDWIQDRLWQSDGAGWLHVRFALYMRTITKL